MKRNTSRFTDWSPDTVETVKPKTILRYTAHRDPTRGGQMIYLTCGIGYASLKDMRRVFPDRTLVRVKADRSNRIFG